jgi:hypothetical protein
MQNTGTLKPRWKTDGRELPPNYAPGNFEAVDSIDLLVEETAMSVDMDPGETDKKPYGIPVSAKLAIALMADFQDLIQPAPDEAEPADELKKLLTRSSAITIDKNILLKTLSQPGCEGIRFYLCKKIVTLSNGSKESFASLVTVGVDAAGKDLHYNFVKDKMSDGLLAAHINNTSLVCEYSAPPPTGNSLKNNNSPEDKLVLLDYALEQVKNIRNQNP